MSKASEGLTQLKRQLDGQRRPKPCEVCGSDHCETCGTDLVGGLCPNREDDFHDRPCDNPTLRCS